MTPGSVYVPFGHQPFQVPAVCFREGSTIDTSARVPLLLARTICPGQRWGCMWYLSVTEDAKKTLRAGGIKTTTTSTGLACSFPMTFHQLSHNFMLQAQPKKATSNFLTPTRSQRSTAPSLLRCFSSVKASTPQMWKASSILWIPWAQWYISAPKHGHFRTRMLHHPSDETHPLSINKPSNSYQPPLQRNVGQNIEPCVIACWVVYRLLPTKQWSCPKTWLCMLCLSLTFALLLAWDQGANMPTNSTQTWCRCK